MKPSGVVIVYHAIGNDIGAGRRTTLSVSTASFRKQLQYLQKHRQVVSLEDLLDGDAGGGRRRVAITFDDGFRSVLTQALPLLKEFGFPATAFLTSRWLEDPSDTSLSEVWEDSQELLNAEDVAVLARADIEIGSHGHTHSDYSRLGATIVEAELHDSYRGLTDMAGRPPRYLAWPYGSSTPESRRAAARAGFDAAFTMDFRTVDRFSVERVPIYAYDNEMTFAFKTSGMYVGTRRSAVVRSSYAALRPVIRSIRSGTLSMLRS